MASIVFFASDLSETAQIRRIRSFARAGHQVASVSMRKPGRLTIAAPDWPDLNLGEIANEQLGKRLAIGLRGLRQLWRERRRLAAADLFVARNIDMVCLALFARWLARRRVPVVYECLDIHGLMTRGGTAGRVARWVERHVLKRTSLLVVSSPAFIDRYFVDVQGYAGPWVLLENKLWFPGAILPRPEPTTARPPLGERPLVLGWVGLIRCKPSFELLLSVAERLRDRLQIVVHGIVHDHALPDFHDRIRAHPNVRYEGPFQYPDGLASVYGSCDLVWAQDLWQAGANSDWLLPNRIYEASWFGCPSIAVAGTQTAAKIDREGLGFVIPAATPEALADFLRGLREENLKHARRLLLARDDKAFHLEDQELDALVARVVGKVA